MAANNPITLIFGGAMIGNRNYHPFSDKASMEALFKVLKEGGVTTIDTAQIYAGSEEILGENKAGDHFIIDTKAAGGFVPHSNKELISRAKESIQKLNVKKVDIFYIHAPEDGYPLTELLASVHEVHKLGLFDRFGLSNYEAADVQKVYDICKEHNYVLPSVYQGNYNPVARKQEEVLFPTLRKLGMAFYAYSPLAGGLLTKTKQQIIDGAGRFDPSHPAGPMYLKMYNYPTLLEALGKWEAIANEEGCSRADLAYRWVRYNSSLSKEYGDAIIVGSSRLEQLIQTLDGINKGPLSKKAVDGIDAIWKSVENEAPLDNFNSGIRKLQS